MKTQSLVFFGLLLVMLYAIPDALGLWIPLSPEQLIDVSSTIFVGKITEINSVDVEYQSQIASDGTIKDEVGPEIMTLEEYSVDIEEFLKNPQDSDTIKVLRATVSGVPGKPSKISGFDIGDRVLFFLPKEERQTHFPGQYLPESFKIPQQCDAKTILHEPRIELKNSFDILQNGSVVIDNFTAGIPMNFVLSKDMDTLYGGGFDTLVSIRKEASNQVDFETKIHAELEQCQWIASAKWDFIPEQGNYRMYLNIKEAGDSGESTSYTGFSVISEPKTIMSPLKQFKSGTPFSEIKCNSGLQLTQRYDGNPACVKPETYFELIKRGWVSNIIKAIQSRDFSEVDPASSYIEKITPTLDDFKEILSKSNDIETIFSKFGMPHNDIGSGIHIYVYELDDLTQVWIGYTDHILYVQHVGSDGKILKRLFEENEN